MKNVLFVLFFMIGILPVVNASEMRFTRKSYVEGTVLKVEKHERPQMSSGSNPSDAPLPDPETYAYDVSVHANCRTYVGRYESWYDYVPSVLSPSQDVQLRLTRAVMFVDVPNQKELRMRIVSRHRERGSCNEATNQVGR